MRRTLPQTLKPMIPLLLLPAIVQMIVMAVDEGWFHRKRGLPRWERIGHPLDTLTVALCYGWLVLSRPAQSHAVVVYVCLAAFSCVFVTKDEFVHSRLCGGAEAWLHAMLFVLHPAAFAAFGVLWWLGADARIIQAQLLLTVAFGLYQIIYWSVAWQKNTKPIDP